MREPGQQALAGLRHRAARHHQRARGIGAGGKWRLPGIAMQQLDAGHVHAQDLVGDLGKGRFHALPVRMHADPQLQPAIGRDPGRGLVEARNDGRAPGGEHRGAVRGLLRVGGQAHADEAAVGLAAPLALADSVHTDHVHGLPQAGRIIAAVQVLAGDVDVGHLFALHQVLLADFPGFASDLAGDRVHRQLHGETDAGARHAPVRHEARLVGGHRLGLAAIALERIRPRQVADGLARLQADGERPDRIGAAVDGDPGVQRQQLAATVGVGHHFIMVLARVRARRQVLAAVLDEAERPLEGLGQPGHAQFFLLQHALSRRRRPRPATPPAPDPVPGPGTGPARCGSCAAPAWR